jgi:anthraniloyl-CoA monooxygenase
MGADMPLPPATAWPVVAASSVPYARGSAVPQALEGPALTETVEEFAAAARRAARAGFDMVEVHAGHGYLLASFLSPLTNKRADELGGSLQGRVRFPLMVIEAVRAEWPAGRPLGVVVSVVDWAPGGTTMAEAVEVVGRFAAAGCDVVRVVAGQTLGRHRPRYDPYWLTHYAETIRNETGVPVIATGDIETVDDVNTIVAGGRADLCLLRGAY